VFSPNSDATGKKNVFYVTSHNSNVTTPNKFPPTPSEMHVIQTCVQSRQAAGAQGGEPSFASPTEVAKATSAIINIITFIWATAF